MILVVAGAFSPSLWMIAWHIWHGNHVVFEGRKFRVPFGWVATAKVNQGAVEDGLDIDKWPSNLVSEELGRATHEMIWVRPYEELGKTETVDQRLQAWLKVSRLLHPDSASQIPMYLKSASQDATCVQSVPYTRIIPASASCLFLESGWTAEFIGEKKDLEAFFDIVRTAN
jgi:hypothetical protein